MLKILINGAKGKMGRAVAAAVQADTELALVGQTDAGDDLAAAIKKSGAQIVVDFTQPSVRMTNVRVIINSGADAVVGTTGFTEEDLKIIDAESKKLKRAALIAPNFAIGAVLLMQFAAQAAKYLPSVEIVEYHHDHKADAPSGTAIKTAQLINEAVGRTAPPVVESQEFLPERSQGARFGNIRIHAVRLPGFVATQEVMLGALGQRLVLRHETINRESFLPGVLLACKKISGQIGLIYGLEKIL
ncbi:4-hydroxy-tetrahydrodipicolinate reductase [Candidatus Termititenax persephonae]|uniref:4-hydroxy-tetrahydrodipicolinate reductase n=1 Tax=Candidatus Termititenax persephonae TaxID=2218525 RepID=A0A388TJF2_9BACT|nr:4-hydroxy-tetrahydrodipicolinate reductase [Candidatus Termititenax persephonae]